MQLKFCLFKLYLVFGPLLLVVESITTPIISHDPTDIHLYLHPFPEDPDQKVELKSWNTLPLNSFSFKHKNKTIFLIHGFISNLETHMPVSVRNEYLRSPALNCNIITVDWGLLSLAQPPLTIPTILESFPLVVENIPMVAIAVAEYIAFLVSQEYLLTSQIHLIGHSLGAHLAGRVGYFVKEMVGQKLGRISGLDPSGPSFQGLSSKFILDKSDAQFVDVYHANMGFLGYLGRMGHVDFYPNGGVIQPGCFGESICSHNIAVEVFSVTINKVIHACQCSPIKMWGWNSCNRCANNNASVLIRAGEFTPIGVAGQFYYTTSPSIRLCKPFEFNC